MPLVLVQNPVIVNEGYDWKDIVGEQYHFPNQYKNRCQPGTPFIYYRGVRRADGKRATPEYFGYGRIGKVRRDDALPESAPKKDWAWYCGIEDYVEFPRPVPSKLNGEFLERIAQNHWSVGVRPLPQDIYDKILELAGMPSSSGEEPPEFPELGAITITEVDNQLLLPRKPLTRTEELDIPKARYSRRALVVGRRAEEIVLRFINEHADELGAKHIRWVAQDAETPGWDIQYQDREGTTIAVEVKGTTAQRFSSVDITIGEWNAAERLGGRYWLYLVADCSTTHPQIQRLCNPAGSVAAGQATVKPVVLRLSALAPIH